MWEEWRNEGSKLKLQEVGVFSSEAAKYSSSSSNTQVVGQAKLQNVVEMVIICKYKSP